MRSPLQVFDFDQTQSTDLTNIKKGAAEKILPPATRACGG
jgi:hypothetical protein